jgi:hypothetical protein
MRNLRPQLFCALAAAIPDVKGNHLTRLGVHGQLNPLLVRFLLDKAGHFIGFHLKLLDQHIVLTGDGLDMEMIRQGLKTLHKKTQ